MEEMKIGRFIRDRRIELGMTQQQLADKLGLTDKAVSKWERAVSYPDITILRELSAALEVTVTELLAGERDQQLPETVPPEVQEVVVDTVAYAETARKRNSGWKFWLFAALTAGCVIAALVLCIVDRFRFWGSLRPIQCIAFGWAVCYPLLRTENHPIRNAMVIASITVYPFIYSIGARAAWHLGIVIVSLAYVWTVYWIARRYRADKGKAVVYVALLGILLHFSIRIMVNRWGLAPVLSVVFLTLAAGAVCCLGLRVLEAVQVKVRQ